MNSLNIVLIFFLVLALVLSLFKAGQRAKVARTIRTFTVTVGMIFYSYWFFQKSVSHFLEKSMSVQVINRVNQVLDIYAIKIINKEQNKFLTKHLGKIRPLHYQIEYFDMSNADEYWIVGLAADGKLVYFLQQAVKQKEEDQKIMIRTYLNHSYQLSQIAEKMIHKNKLLMINHGIAVALGLLLLFLNLVLLSRKPKTSGKTGSLSFF